MIEFLIVALFIIMLIGFLEYLDTKKYMQNIKEEYSSPISEVRKELVCVTKKPKLKLIKGIQ